MDIYSKLFFINIVVFCSVALLENLLDGFFSEVCNVEVLGFWSLATLLSVPFYAIYLILSI